LRTNASTCLALCASLPLTPTVLMLSVAGVPAELDHGCAAFTRAYAPQRRAAPDRPCHASRRRHRTLAAAISPYDRPVSTPWSSPADRHVGVVAAVIPPSAMSPLDLPPLRPRAATIATAAAPLPPPPAGIEIERGAAAALAVVRARTQRPVSARRGHRGTDVTAASAEAPAGEVEHADDREGGARRSARLGRRRNEPAPPPQRSTPKAKPRARGVAVWRT
jgi:hypothetical protein